MKWTMRLSLLATAAVLAVSLAGCGGDEKPGSSEAPTTTTSAKATLTTEATKSGITTSTTQVTTTTTAATTTEPTTAPTETPAAGGEAVAKLAASLEGTPFLYGAAGPDAFDNSGLVYYCLTKNGISVPRRTTEQFAGGTAVEMDALQPGDLVFYSMETEGVAQFVGVYLGDGQFIAANNEEKPACLYGTSMKYFADRFVGARRYA